MKVYLIHLKAIGFVGAVIFDVDVVLIVNAVFVLLFLKGTFEFVLGVVVCIVIFMSNPTFVMLG